MILARQGASTRAPFSLVRDNQFRSQLEESLNELHGKGVLSGCEVTKVAGYTIQVSAVTKFFANGYVYTLSTPQNYTATPSSPGEVVYLWGKIVRTAADQQLASASDTYALSLVHTETLVAPSSDHFPLEAMGTDGSGVTTITDLPGKFLETGEQDTQFIIYVRVPPNEDRAVKVDFSGIGSFAGDYHVRADIDQDPMKTLVSELIANKTGSVLYLLIQNASDAPDGTYYTNQDLRITITLQGHNFTQAAGTTPVPVIQDFNYIAGGLSAPVADEDLAGAYLYANGGRTATGNLNMGANRIVAVADPAAAADAVPRSYALAPTIVTLTNAATIATDASLGKTFKVSIAQDRTLGAPTNPTDGQGCIWRVKNTDGSDHTLSLAGGAGGFRFGTTITALTAIVAGKTDYMGAVYNAADDRWDVVAYAKGL